MYNSEFSKKGYKKLKVPIIGIGATSECNGQILVAEDLLGLTRFDSKFLKKFENLNLRISRAFSNFSKDVKNRKYPQKKIVTSNMIIEKNKNSLIKTIKKIRKN